MNMRFLTIAVLAACGGGGDSVDAPNVPSTINVSGVASSIGIGGRTPVQGVLVEAYRNGADSTVVAMATSDAAGMFTVQISTNGGALDGYLLAKHASFKHTYLYPPAPLAADTNAATVLLLSESTFDNAAALAQAPQEPGKGWIGIMVIDAANNPVAGATISSSPAGIVRYNGDSGLPNRNATVTAADGIGYVFNVAAGTVNVSASKSGSTFQSHDVNARADQVTTTLIQ
ncbi:MAG TPA: carboxypeptidase-like regulatory domain-containing protein [Xanthomonadales bacterium]|nr:carboxypeptidase-like regulatory domain-containing protein [Xanthomonadales bacterium]